MPHLFIIFLLETILNFSSFYICYWNNSSIFFFIIESYFKNDFVFDLMPELGLRVMLYMHSSSILYGDSFWHINKISWRELPSPNEGFGFICVLILELQSRRSTHSSPFLLYAYIICVFVCVVCIRYHV